MRIGLIGCGTWGRNILRELTGLDATVVVVEPDETRRARARGEGAAEAVAGLGEMGPVDGVVVATPASTHAETILALDRAGSTAPVFCEKPLADTGANARRILERDGPPVFVMHIWRYHAGVQKLKELFESGLVGSATQLHSVRTNWTSPRSDVDTLANMAPHDLSIFQFLLGALPRPVHAVAERIDGRIVGCLAVLQAPGGPACLFEVSNRYGEKRREFRLHGTEGVLVLPDDRQHLVQLVSGPGDILPETVRTFPYEPVPALRTELATFLRYLGTNDAGGLCDAREGAEIVFCIDKIRASS